MEKTIFRPVARETTQYERKPRDRGIQPELIEQVWFRLSRSARLNILTAKRCTRGKQGRLVTCTKKKKEEIRYERSEKLNAKNGDDTCKEMRGPEKELVNLMGTPKIKSPTLKKKNINNLGYLKNEKMGDLISPESPKESVKNGDKRIQKK
jgi:hypothetical protein